MRVFLRFLLLCAFSFAGVASAAMTPVELQQYRMFANSPWENSPSTACSTWAASGGYSGSFLPPSACQLDTGYVQQLSVQTIYSCQSFPNSSLSGSSCLCNSGFSDVNGSCTPICEAGWSFNSAGYCQPPTPPGNSLPEDLMRRCKDSQTLYNSTLGERYTEVTMPGSISSGTSLCVPSAFAMPVGAPAGTSTSCSMNFERDISYQDDKGVWQTRGQLDMGGMSGSYVSLPCGDSTPEIPKVSPGNLNPPCPTGQQQGTFNGSTVCKPFGPDVKVKTDDSNVEKTDAAGNKTTEKTDTVCQGSKCTTTTTTTNSSGSVTGTDSKTTTKDDFCVKNPGSKQCGQVSGGGGSPSNGCLAGDQTAGCSKLGSAPGVTPVANVNKPMTITKDTGWGPENGSCPAPRAMNFSFATINMPFDLLCQFASGIRPLVLGLAYLGAAFTFFGIGRRS